MASTQTRWQLAGDYFENCNCDVVCPCLFSPNAPLTEGSLTHTQAMWLVEDVESEVAALKARGVVFEEYDVPELSTVNSIATVGPGKGAWFQDSEGNLLSLAQFD
jgi:hypothetical protein